MTVDSSEQSSLHDKQLLIAETLPTDWRFLDVYQAQAQGPDVIAYDPDGRTIRGKQPLAYMLAGLDEEAHEVLFDIDKIEPAYHRFGALALFGADNGPALEPGVVTATALARHTKEFGDVAWYLVNALSLCGLSYSATIEPGLAALRLKQLANMATGRGDPEFHDHVERTATGFFLYPAVISELLAAAHDLARPAQGNIPADSILKRREERGLAEERLVIATGQYTVLAQHLLVNRFNTDYQSILDANIAKLRKRMLDNTLFDKSGGDDR